MRSFFDKKYWMTLLVILLIVLNVSILATFLFRSNRYRNLPERPVFTQATMPNREGLFLRNELGLDEKQFIQFREIRDAYQRKTTGIEEDIRDKKAQLLEEMVKNEPDPARISRIGDEIGLMHAKLLSETGNYYLEIRNLCNEEQKVRLDVFFSRVIKGEDNHTNPDRRIPFNRGTNGRSMRPANRN